MDDCVGVARAHGLKRRWFANSTFNLFGGLGTAAVNLLLPAIVAKYLSTDAFSLWSLALQIIMYVNLLGLGLQVATARAVSYAGDAGVEGEQRLPVVARAARSISGIASGFALLLIIALAFGYPRLFPNVPASLTGEFRLVLVLFGLISVAQIRSEPDMGVFQGLHRYGVFVTAKFATRALAVLLVWVGVEARQSLTVLALLMAVSMILLWPIMRLAVAGWVRWGRDIAGAAVDRAQRWELLQYCGALSVMSVSMLVVNTAGVLIVGRMDFQMTGAYAIAMTAATVPVGLLGAALSPLLTTASAMFASAEARAQLPRLLARSTLIVTIGLNLFFVGIEVLYPEILRLWVGSAFVASAGPLLVILVAAHCLRNVAAPYALALYATAQQRRAVVTSGLEGLVNLAAAVALGLRYGAIGVAFGTLIGSVVGVAGALAWNTKRTPLITPHPWRFSLLVVVLPILVFLPLHLFLLHLLP